MLNAYLMIGTNDRTLEQTPNALDTVSVNVANNPFVLRVINPLMFRVGVLNSPISRHFVCVDRFRVRRGVVVNKLVKHGLCSMGNDLQPNHSVSLNCSDSDSLVSFVAPTAPAHFPADIRF